MDDQYHFLKSNLEKVPSNLSCVSILGAVASHVEDSERKNGVQEFQDVGDEALGEMNHKKEEVSEMVEIEHMFAELQETMSSISMELSVEESVKKKENMESKKGCHRMQKDLIIDVPKEEKVEQCLQTQDDTGVCVLYTAVMSLCCHALYVCSIYPQRK